LEKNNLSIKHETLLKKKKERKLAIIQNHQVVFIRLNTFLKKYKQDIKMFGIVFKVLKRNKSEDLLKNKALKELVNEVNQIKIDKNIEKLQETNEELEKTNEDIQEMKKYVDSSDRNNVTDIEKSVIKGLKNIELKPISTHRLSFKNLLHETLRSAASPKKNTRRLLEPIKTEKEKEKKGGKRKTKKQHKYSSQ
jgi:hypothetical protein